MSAPTEHKTVQARILEYAEAIGWTLVSQKDAEQRRGFDPPSPRLRGTGPEESRAKGRTLFFEDLLDANPSSPNGFAAARVREFNPRYAEAEGALPGKFRHLHTDIYGNLEFTIQRVSNRRDRREHKEDLDRPICQQAIANSSGWKFSRRLRENRLLASAHFCNGLLQNFHIV